MVDLIPEIYDGDSLAASLAKELKGGERILIPRASRGNENLARVLREHGAFVDDVPTYETVYERSALIDLKEELQSGSIDCAVFTSASTVRGFAEAVGEADYSGLLRRVSENRQKPRLISFIWKPICRKRQPSAI